MSCFQPDTARRYAVVLALLGATACSSESPADVASDAAAPLGVVSYALLEDLPNCRSNRNGQVHYVWETGLLYYCDGPSRTYVPLDLQAGGGGTSWVVDVQQGAASCPADGITVSTGPDANGDGVIDTVTSSQQVCHGQDGQDGEDGVDGAEGAPGADGSSCSVQENADGTATINCTDGTSAVIGGTTDCAGVPGGAAVLDECGVCDGPGIPPGDCDCNGNAVDVCGVCGGAGIPQGACDCDGNVLDACGVCGGPGVPSGDCDCNGNAVDVCGVCGGPGIPPGACDCDGNVLDACGVCGGSGIPAGACDCAGNVNDECGVCGGSGVPAGACDCDGNVTDVCGVCGGLGLPPGDCDCFGNVDDECGVCGGSGVPAGACDCAGNVNDECGVCGGSGIPAGDCDCNGNVLDACGVCGGGGTGCGSHPLEGTYITRSVLWSRQDGSDELKSVSYSVVEINDDGSLTTLRDDTCYTYSEPQNSGGWYTWQRASWTQEINNQVPVVRSVSDLGDGTYLRQSETTALGFDPALCTGGCNCPGGLPTYSDGAPSHCALVDHDGDGRGGVAAWGDTAAPSSVEDDSGTAKLHQVGLVTNHWIITPSGDGYHTGVVGDGDTAGNNPSRQQIVGCTDYALCGFLTPRANQFCPREYNTVQFVPIAPGYSCGDLTADYSFTDLLSNPQNLGFDPGQDGTMPSEAVCPHPPAP